MKILTLIGELVASLLSEGFVLAWKVLIVVLMLRYLGVQI